MVQYRHTTIYCVSAIPLRGFTITSSTDIDRVKSKTLKKVSLFYVFIQIYEPLKGGYWSCYCELAAILRFLF